jgi:hypothetical protein
VCHGLRTASISTRIETRKGGEEKLSHPSVGHASNEVRSCVIAPTPVMTATVEGGGTYTCKLKSVEPGAGYTCEIQGEFTGPAAKK